MDDSDMHIVEINGERYERVTKKGSKMSAKMFSFVAMGMVMGGGDMFGQKEPERPNVDVVKEFELICNKKSNLTKSQRDWVEWMFHTNYTKIKE